MVGDLRTIARALGGEVSGRNTISVPTPGHSRRDRGTIITLDPTAPGGFLVHSFNGGDPLEIKDMVRQALGMPAWEPGDEQDRRIRPDRVKAWDRAAIDREADETYHLDGRSSGSGSTGPRQSGTRPPTRAARSRKSICDGTAG